MTEGGGDWGGPWSPQNKEKIIIRSKKKKNVKFGSNFSHMVPLQNFFGLILNFLGYIHKVFIFIFGPYFQILTFLAIR
jgi:hypothetical protein